ncbi:MAG: HU family DNA-binding protein [Patescibacteria group bacterium]|nr:HU family DNA-binding protein [Patescibacteria group bacterium]MDD3435041.1 HU family DNA-binding protein [Patescibacteria group bacterium]
MNKAQLIERLSKQVDGVSKKQAEQFLNALTSTLTSELKEGREVTITGFGTFLSRVRYARGGVNPQNPTQRIIIPEVRVAKFKTGYNLKQALKGKR